MNLNPIAANMNEVSTEKMTVLFSYKTPVAVIIDEGLGFVFYRTAKRWSNTTTRHINKWLGIYGRVAGEKPQEYFDNLLAEVNCHQELIKTLKEIADIAAGKTVTVDNIFEIQEMAESAIAKAEGK